ncbi:MAG: hypothetical protein ACTSU6_02570 [Candidatus Njordarchaeales archaeon]
MKHLESKGWPKLNNNQIIAELPDIYKNLEVEGLLDTLKQKGFTYQVFTQSALQARHRCEMMEAMRNKFGFNF